MKNAQITGISHSLEEATVALVRHVVAVKVIRRFRVCVKRRKVIIAAEGIFIPTELYAASKFPQYGQYPAQVQSQAAMFRGQKANQKCGKCGFALHFNVIC